MQQRKQERQEKKQEKKCTKKQELDSEHTPGNQVDIFIWGAQDLLLLLLFLLYPRKGRTICDADDGVTGQRKRTAAAAAGSRVWGEGSGDERSITAAEYAPPRSRRLGELMATLGAPSSHH